MSLKDSARKAGIAGVLGLSALVGMASLGGCADSEIAKIETSIKNPRFEKFKKETIVVYKNINPNHLTEKQREYLERFEKNRERYMESLYPWMNQNNLTVRDKIYVVMDEECANAMLNMLR